MPQTIHFNVLYGLTLPLTVSPYERVFMGSIWVLYPFTFSLSSGPATLTLLPLFTRLEALPFEVVYVEGLNDGLPAKEFEALIGTEGIASSLAPLSRCCV